MPITPDQYSYPFDPTGTAVPNKVSGEVHVITQQNHRDFSFIIPKFAPFFATGLTITFTDINGNPAPLVEGVDYYFGHHFLAASRAVSKQVYGSISFITKDFKGTMSLGYQTLGGMWTYDQTYLNELMTNIISNPRSSSWDSIVELPALFPVIDHEWNLIDMVGMADVVAGLFGIETAIRDPEGAGTGGGSGSVLMDHVLDYQNPHQTTKLHVGLGNVANYSVATQLESEAGIADNKYMTPLRVKEAITSQVGTAFSTHAGRTDNPHNTTATHVGLGDVQNYGVATQLEAEAGTVNNKYLTPLLTKQAIQKLAIDPLNTHTQDTSNPHQVDKNDVGLGSVENYGIATKLEAETGTSNILYMTPLRVKEAVDEFAVEPLNAHKQDNLNPHAVTKAQVGLSNVDNYATATQAEAEAGTAVDKFMTAALVKAAIVAMTGGDVGSHLTDTNNPHDVTATQVGAYTKVETDDLLDDKLGSNETAFDSVRHGNLTVAELTDQILANKIDNAAEADTLNGKSYNDIMSAVSTSTVANASHLETKTLTEVLQLAQAQTSSNSAEFEGMTAAEFYDSIPANANVTQQVAYDGVPALSAGTDLYTELFNIPLPSAGDGVVLVTGAGTTEAGTDSFSYLLKVNSRDYSLDVVNMLGIDSTLTFFATQVAGKVTVWMRSALQRQQVSLSELSNQFVVWPDVTPRNYLGASVPANVTVNQPAGWAAAVEVNVRKSVETLMTDLTTLFSEFTV